MQDGGHIVNFLVLNNVLCLHCALASSAVYCNRSCLFLWVCLWRPGGRCPNLTTASACAVFASLWALFSLIMKRLDKVEGHISEFAAKMAAMLSSVVQETEEIINCEAGRRCERVRTWEAGPQSAAGGRDVVPEILQVILSLSTCLACQIGLHQFLLHRTTTVIDSPHSRYYQPTMMVILLTYSHSPSFKIVVLQYDVRLRLQQLLRRRHHIRRSSRSNNVQLVVFQRCTARLSVSEEPHLWQQRQKN